MYLLNTICKTQTFLPDSSTIPSGRDTGENPMRITFRMCSPMRHCTDVPEDVAVWCGEDPTKQNVGTGGKLQAFPGAPEAGRAPGGCLLRYTDSWSRDSLGQQLSGPH